MLTEYTINTTKVQVNDAFEVIIVADGGAYADGVYETKEGITLVIEGGKLVDLMTPFYKDEGEVEFSKHKKKDEKMKSKVTFKDVLSKLGIKFAEEVVQEVKKEEAPVSEKVKVKLPEIEITAEGGKTEITDEAGKVWVVTVTPKEVEPVKEPSEVATVDSPADAVALSAQVAKKDEDNRVLLSKIDELEKRLKSIEGASSKAVNFKKEQDFVEKSNKVTMSDILNVLNKK